MELSDETLQMIGVMVVGALFTLLSVAFSFFTKTVYQSAREMNCRYAIEGIKNDHTLHTDSKFYKWIVFFAMLSTTIITSLIWYVAVLTNGL